MTIANVKGLVAKFMITGLVAGAVTLASPAKAQAQQFAVGVEFGHPAYVADRDDNRYDRDNYRQDRDGYRVDRDDYRQKQEFRERQERAEYLQRQEYLRHEQWEHYHHDRDDRPYGYR